MLRTEEKKFYADTVWGASKLSRCSIQRGALLVKGGYILTYGYNQKIVQSKDYELSAICKTMFEARDLDLSGSALFSTYFPPLEDMKLIISFRVPTVYFFGKVDDPYAVELTNKTAQEGLTLQLVQLK